VLGDRERVLQVGRALVDNALLHTPPGTHIRVRTGTEPATVANGKGTAFVEVEDDGPGIKRRELEHVFDRFHTGNAGGSGLGLAIARELANRMYGRLEVRSRSGETVFRLTLPLAGQPPQRERGLERRRLEDDARPAERPGHEGDCAAGERGERRHAERQRRAGDKEGRRRSMAQTLLPARQRAPDPGHGMPAIRRVAGHEIEAHGEDDHDDRVERRRHALRTR